MFAVKATAGEPYIVLIAIQEVAATVGAILDSSCTLALKARAACRLDRGDIEGAVDDLLALQVMGLDVQQVKRHTVDIKQSLLFAHNRLGSVLVSVCLRTKTNVRC